MIAKDTLRQVVLQQKDGLFKAGETVRRDLLGEILEWFKDNRVMILTGLRRSGKSTILSQLMAVKSDYCYVNFEDERFIGFEAQDFEQLNEVLIEVYNNPKIYFFDEIQNIDKFESFVRRLQDQGKKAVITGSNASLLSKELGTKLTGRYKPFEVYPFSFGEFLRLNHSEPEKSWLYTAEKRVKLAKLFEDYASNGGLPEYLKNRDKEYVRTVYENILYRDVISRYSIKRQRLLKEMVSILATNISSLFTYNSIKDILKLANSITVKEYISYLSNSYLFFELQKFDFSVRRQLNSPKKIYLIDPAFNQLLGLNFSMNKGRVLENLVFIEMKRRGKEIYYYSGKNECDFIIKDGVKANEAVQVCYLLSKSNRKREIEGLLEAMGKLKHGLILTHEQEEEIRAGGKRITVMPVWKWMLAEYFS